MVPQRHLQTDGPHAPRPEPHSPIPGMLLKAGGIRNPDQGMGQGAPTTQNQACQGFPTCGGLLVQFPSHRLGASYVFERDPKALH